jgi:hypothetical protein
MSDENKTNETKKPIDFDDDKEPIESIEKTVEDLKRKIQELSDDEQQKEKEEEDQAKANDPKEKITEMCDSAAKTISSGFTELKGKAVEAANSEEMKKSIEYIKANAVKAMDVAKDKFNQIKNDPNVQAAGAKAADSFGKFADTAKTKGQEFYDHLDDHTKANVEGAYNKASKAVSDGVKAVDEFINKPEVQEKITEVKTAAVDLAQKGAETVKDFIDNAKNGKRE